MIPITPGMFHETTIIIGDEHLARTSGQDLHIPVLGTPVLVSLLEETAHRALSEGLEPGQSSVGTLVHLRHLAATPSGMTVRLRAEVVQVDGRKVVFRMEAWDEVEKIGEGEQERFVIDVERFLARVQRKAAAPRKPG